MKKNVGTTDRYIRFLVGVALFINIIVLKPGLAGTILLAIGGIAFLLTAYFSFCSLYLPLKICTITGCRCDTGETSGPGNNTPQAG